MLVVRRMTGAGGERGEYMMMNYMENAHEGTD